MKNLYLDAYNLLYRARYSGMNRGKNSTTFNFFRSLRVLVEKFDPDNVYFVLDGSPKKRLQLSESYKKNRVYNDLDDFNRQRNDIINLIKEYFPINVIKHDDYECDDLLARLSRDHCVNGSEGVVVSSDTDFIQLISDTIKLYNPIRKDFILSPEYDYVTWKSLKGDASDNIEGFKGVGDKRAQKLVKNKELLQDFLSEKEKEDKFNKNYELIKFHDIPESDMENVQYFLNKKSNWEELKNIFKEYEFNSLINDKSWNKFIKTFSKLFKGN